MINDRNCITIREIKRTPDTMKAAAILVMFKNLKNQPLYHDNYSSLIRLLSVLEKIVSRYLCFSCTVFRSTDTDRVIVSIYDILDTVTQFSHNKCDLLSFTTWSRFNHISLHAN